MNRSHPLLALLSMCVLGLAARAQSVQLADGRVLLANVEQATEDGLTVRRLDNGGVLELRWDHLTAASATTWKRKYDLIGDGDDEVLVRADEVVYVSNGTRQSVIGRITDPSGDPLIVQAKGVTYPIARRNLQGVRKVEVPATQIYTTDEFYGEQLAEHAPGDSADKHMLLAEQLIKVRDYDHASEHLTRAKELGNSSSPDKLEVLIDRLKRYKAAAKELGMIEQIQIARSRGKLRDFEKGVEVIAQFEEQYPDSKLKNEFEREKDRFEKARARYLTQRVADQWRRQITSVSEKKVLEDGFTLQAARDFAENGMSDAIVERLEKQLELEGEEIRALWSQRASTPVGKRTEHFSYGDGSWVLGEKEILKDTAVAKAQEKQAGQQRQPAGNDREIERFAKLLRQAMERRQRAAQAGGEQRQLTDEGWWQQASRAEKVSWLRAYYAEYGGELVVKFATATKCISCYGEGTLPTIGADGRPVREKCFLCQDTKWQRSFKAY